MIIKIIYLLKKWIMIKQKLDLNMKIKIIIIYKLILTKKFMIN